MECVHSQAREGELKQIKRGAASASDQALAAPLGRCGDNRSRAAKRDGVSFSGTAGQDEAPDS